MAKFSNLHFQADGRTSQQALDFSSVCDEYGNFVDTSYCDGIHSLIFPGAEFFLAIL